jgi:hypothetical protein
VKRCPSCVPFKTMREPAGIVARRVGREHGLSCTRRTTFHLVSSARDLDNHSHLDTSRLPRTILDMLLHGDRTTLLRFAFAEPPRPRQTLKVTVILSSVGEALKSRRRMIERSTPRSGAAFLQLWLERDACFRETAYEALNGE